MRSAGESSWTVVVKTGVLAVGSWLERALFLVCTIVACVLQAVRRSRAAQTVEDLVQRTAQMEEQRNKINVNFRLADDTQTHHDERSRRNKTAADWRLRGTRWWAQGCVSWLSCQHVVANIETGKLEHGIGTVEEPVGQPLMKWHRGKAGLGCSWIIRVLTGGR